MKSQQPNKLVDFISLLDQLSIIFNNIEQILINDQEMKDNIYTGYDHLDLILGSLPRGKITLIHGAIFKTTFVLNILKNIGKSRNVIYFSSHHSTNEIALNLISLKSGIPVSRLRKALISQNEIESFVNIFEHLAETRIYLCNPLGKEFTPDFIAYTCNQLEKTEGIKIDVVAVDSINQLKITTGENQTDRLERYAFELQDLAREIDVAVLLTANTVKEVNNRINHRPAPEDIFLSSSINHFCENIIALYYDGYYNPDTPDSNIVEVHIQKSYSVGCVRIIINPETLQMQNLQLKNY